MFGRLPRGATAALPLFVMKALLLLLVFGASACVHAPPLSEEPPRTQLLVLGMTHSGHLESERWGIAEVQQAIRNIDPDVVITEIPPDRLPGVLALWEAEQRVEDDRVLLFPEYVQGLLPLSNEMDFAIEPGAGWHQMMADYRKMRIQAFHNDEEFAEQKAAYEEAEAWVAAWNAAHPAAGPEDDPLYMHSPAYDRRTKGELGPYDHFLNDVIGRPAGWTYVNEEHYVLIEEALRKHPGKRILITFGAGHKYWFLEQFKNLPEVDVLEVRPYLPGGEDWELDLHQRGVEEVYAGLDDLEIWRSIMRGDALFAWARLEARLDIPAAEREALLESWRVQKGMNESEFLGRLWLGEPEVVWNIPLGGLIVTMEVQWALQSADKADTLRVGLRPDNSYPGGFAWLFAEIPTPPQDD